MNRHTTRNGRFQSILAFSFLSTYILSFLFEGQVLYGLQDLHHTTTSGYILLAIVAHFFGLFTCGFIAKTAAIARCVMLGGMGLSLLTTLPFFFPPSPLWSWGLIVGGYTSGWALASWGYFLKAFTPKNERLKTCADLLILSNIIMVLINVVTIKISPLLGLTLVMLCLPLGMICTLKLPVDLKPGEQEKVSRRADRELHKPLMLLCMFIAILTINSGLMYEVVNPAFVHLTALTSWYWAVPYIAALFIMRNLPVGIKHARMLYAGMAMMMGSFIGFMLLGRKALDYLVIDTLLLAACGVFDLFWWSILGEMLDYTENPSTVWGIGLSANVLGVLSGGVIGMVVMSAQRLSAEITVIALTVVCISLAILPLLNRHLTLLLKSHAYLTVYDTLGENQQTALLSKTQALSPLTLREQEVVQLLLSGKSNREIAAALHITEHTVKTHTRNIYAKYAVRTRAELISSLLKGEVL
jgi:DNA-binding CsgD family transcriptional regulator